MFNVRLLAVIWLPLSASFQTELSMNTHVVVSDMRHDVSKIREEIGGQARSVSITRIQPIDDGRMLTVS